MAEGGFDPCECVCTHEYAMRRLINLVSNETERLLLRLKIQVADLIMTELRCWNRSKGGKSIPRMQCEVKKKSKRLTLAPTRN